MLEKAALVEMAEGRYRVWWTFPATGAWGVGNSLKESTARAWVEAAKASYPQGFHWVERLSPAAEDTSAYDTGRGREDA